MHNFQLKHKLGLLFVLTLSLLFPLFFGAQRAFAATLTESQIIGAQRSYSFCTDRDWESGDDYSDDTKQSIREICNEANAAELAEGCDDISNLPEGKYTVDATGLLLDFCSLAANKDPNTGYGAEGGNNLADQLNPEQAVDNEGSYLNDIINQAKYATGCNQNISTAIDGLLICTATNEEVVAACRDGSGDEQIGQVCAEIREFYGDEAVEVIVAQAEEAVAEASGEVPEAESCESEGGEFSFILCPMLNGASEGIEWIDQRIMNALDINEEYYQNPDIREAWRNFRNIAYIVLIPVMLVMVIGTALQFSFVDAYTVKRALPRLLAAIIFITLSFDITTLMVDVSNVVGRGTAGLIASPFGGTDDLELTDVFTASAGEDIAFSGAVLGGIGVAALSGVTIGSLLITAGVALLAIFVVFALLTLREMLIIFLMVIAPIAIIAWIFPGNDKPWKLWWASFSKMLYFYPIVIGLIYIGRAFASIINSTDSDEIVVVTTIIKLIAFVGPFFFIPKAFQFAGGALGNLAGMVNDREKGLFDRARKARAGMKADQRQQIKSGGGGVFGVGKNTDAGKWMGKRGASAYGLGRSVKNNGLVGGLRGSSITAATNKNVSEAAHDFEDKNADFKAFSADDTVLAAAEAGGFSEVRDALMASGDSRFQGENGKKIASQTAQLVMQAKNQMGEKAYKKAALVAKAKTGTYYRHKDANGNYTGQDLTMMMEEINKVYGDDRQAAGGALMEMRSASMGAGRVDLGGFSAGAGLTNLQKLHDSPSSRSVIQKDLMNDILDNQPPSTLAHPSIKQGDLERNIMPVMQDRIQKAYDDMNDASLTQDQRDAAEMNYTREIAAAENLHNSLKQTKPAMAKLFADGVMAYSPELRRPVTAQEDREMTGTGQYTGGQPLGPGHPEGPTLPEEIKVKKVKTVRVETHSKASDPVYQNYQRQWQSAEADLKQQQMLAQNQQGGPGSGPGTPTVPPISPRI